MHTKTILITFIIVLAVAVGGYYAYTTMQQEAPATDTNTELPSDQVQAQEVTVGTGLEAKPGDTVSVLYVGQFQDGTVFDSSEMHGNQPLTFVLGAPGMIAGFQIGVNTMKEGGERLIAVPPALAYGAEEVKDANGNVVIPANATLIFDIKLVKVTPATSTAATTTTP
jgi:FKBP-type peptidyl-prolyl cis-trans isomerase